MRNPIPRQACPYCGYMMDRSTNILSDTLPKKGDVTLCIKCAGVAVFDENITMQRPTLKEIAEIKDSPLWPVVERLRVAVEERNKKSV